MKSKVRVPYSTIKQIERSIYDATIMLSLFYSHDISTTHRIFSSKPSMRKCAKRIIFKQSSPPKEATNTRPGTSFASQSRRQEFMRRTA